MLFAAAKPQRNIKRRLRSAGVPAGETRGEQPGRVWGAGVQWTSLSRRLKSADRAAGETRQPNGRVRESEEKK